MAFLVPHAPMVHTTNRAKFDHSHDVVMAVGKSLAKVSESGFLLEGLVNGECALVRPAKINQETCRLSQTQLRHVAYT